MKHSSLLLFIILMTSCATHRQKMLRGIQQIEDLKNNALLVRLKESKEKIKMVDQLEGQHSAKALEASISEDNQEVMTGFKAYYNFSEVFYFYASDAPALRNGDFDKVKLFDVEGNSQPAIQFKDRFYLVGEFGKAYSDQIIYEDKEGNRRVAAGTDGMPALVILNTDYIQIEKPFPSQVLLKNKAPKAEAIRTLNELLHTYHIQMQARKMKLAFKQKKKDAIKSYRKAATNSLEE